MDFLRKIINRNYLNRIPVKKVKQQYVGQKTPVYLEVYDMWVVDTDCGVEYGDINYVMSEFTSSGVRYRFTTKRSSSIEQLDHEHDFNAVLSAIADDPENFSYQPFEEDYSLQEIKYIESILSKYREVGRLNF